MIGQTSKEKLQKLAATVQLGNCRTIEPLSPPYLNNKSLTFIALYKMLYHLILWQPVELYQPNFINNNTHYLIITALQTYS